MQETIPNEIQNPEPEPKTIPTPEPKPLEFDGKPVTAEMIKEMDGKIKELSKTATAYESTQKERDAAVGELTEIKAKQEALELAIGGRKSVPKVSLEDDVPEPVALNDKTGEYEYNPAFTMYFNEMSKILREVVKENQRLKQVAGVTGAQNVQHGNVLARQEFKNAHGYDNKELDEIIRFGIEENIIPSYQNGESKTPIIGGVDQIEKARDVRLAKLLREASAKGDMETVEKLIQNNYAPRKEPTAPRVSGSGDVDKTDAEKKFQQIAMRKMDIGQLTEPEVDELIKKGLYSQETKRYRWKPAQKT